MESTLVMVAVAFSKEAFAETALTLAGQRMGRVTAQWIKSIGTNVDRAA